MAALRKPTVRSCILLLLMRRSHWSGTLVWFAIGLAIAAFWFAILYVTGVASGGHKQVRCTAAASSITLDRPAVVTYYPEGCTP